ncbi:MAG: YlxM family DNA-binding protein [Clostridiales bacterium]|nr:YlxM family DNA-binding protein [Clostridiales bacterium]
MKNQAYRMAMLYDFYGDLLTPRQKEFYDLYYNDDLSLAEIAENYDITRQGVRDTIVRAEKTLEEIEEKTGLIQRYHRTRATAASLRDLCGQIQALNQAKLANQELDTLCTRLGEAIDDLERE